MSDTQTLPDWLHVGAKVVSFTPHQWKDGGSITVTTVTKIGKRDVVLENGERFNVERLQRSNGAWSMNTYLHPPDHPDVLEARAANRKHRAYRSADTAWDTFARGRTTENAAAVVAAVQAWIEAS